MRTCKLEFATTRDLQAPLYTDDPDLSYGWRMVPMPPKPDGRGKWRIFDSSSDRKTKWVRCIADIEGAP